MCAGPEDGDVLVPVGPEVGVVRAEDMEQLMEDEAGVARVQAPAEWRPELQEDGLAPAGVVGGHLERVSANLTSYIIQLIWSPCHCSLEDIKRLNVGILRLITRYYEITRRVIR